MDYDDLMEEVRRTIVDLKAIEDIAENIQPGNVAHGRAAIRFLARNRCGRLENAYKEVVKSKE